MRRPETRILGAQLNLANTYGKLGRPESAMQIERDVYYGYLKVAGEENEVTLSAANNYAAALIDLKRIEEAKELLRKIMPVARRALGKDNRITLKMKRFYAKALYRDPAATLDDLREAVTTLEETSRTARRVLGGAHPTVVWIEQSLKASRAVLRARETPGDA